jgi:hypothetical protein
VKEERMTGVKITTTLLWLCVVGLVMTIGLNLMTIGNIQREETVRHSCMDAVVTPDPESTDYDNQALEFTAQIRKCMRG